jgi:hypothetical protein
MRTQYASLLADMGAIKVPAGYSLRGRNTSWLDDPKAVRFLNRRSLARLENLSSEMDASFYTTARSGCTRMQSPARA